MNKETKKNFIRSMEIDACLKSIKECTNVARYYIAGEYEVNDVDELVTSLASVKEDIEYIDKLIIEMQEEYEKEIEELKYEQLQ